MKTAFFILSVLVWLVMLVREADLENRVPRTKETEWIRTLVAFAWLGYGFFFVSFATGWALR